MQNRLQAVFPVAFPNDRGAGVEADVQIGALTGSDREAAACDLAGGNLDAGLYLAA